MNVQAQTAVPLNNAVLGGSLFAVVVTLGVIVAALMSKGHAAFNSTSEGVIWGLPVVTYVFFAMASTGLALVAALGTAFGFSQFTAIAKRCVWLSICMLLSAFAALALELGHPFRMLWAIPANFQFLSPLLWMGVFYLACLAVLALKFRRIEAGDWRSPATHRLAKAGVAGEVLALGTLGMAFGMMAMRPLWYGPDVPLYFLATGCAVGTAFAVLGVNLAYRFDQRAMPPDVRRLMTGSLPALFGATLAVYAIFLAYRVVGGLWTNAAGMEAMDHVVASGWFWVEVIALVTALALMASSARGAPGTQVTAALLAIVALFIGRYEFVVGGQIVPTFKGAWEPNFVSYAPSATEWTITLLAISLAFALYAAGERLFNLSAAPAGNADV